MIFGTASIKSTNYSVSWTLIPEEGIELTIEGPSPAPGGGEHVTLSWPNLPYVPIAIEATSTLENQSWEVAQTISGNPGSDTLSTPLSLPEGVEQMFYRISLIQTTPE